MPDRMLLPISPVPPFLLVVTVEDHSLAIDQAGLLVRGRIALDFDSLHAIPLYSQRPISAPAAY